MERGRREHEGMTAANKGKDRQPNSNKFCRASDLANEASVEQFFVIRLLRDLGYQDQEIIPKGRIRAERIPHGRRQEWYSPDFILETSGSPRWLIDAKSATERIDDYTYQCAGYALMINRKHEGNPLKYYMLTNGLLTRVYVWDREEAILSLRFADWEDGNTRYATLKRLFAATQTRKGWEEPATPNYRGRGHKLERPGMDVVKKKFARCHRIIWKSEKMSPQTAFVEFAKLIFVKLWEDRKLRDDPAHMEAIGRGIPLPAKAVRFSTHWVSEREKDDPNPIDSLFQQLVKSLEQEIVQRRRKRIFREDEHLELGHVTAKQIVQQLERYYLFGIDEDLNGRMFEAFLTATMRGQDLGQYFTPRTIVKLMTRLAHLHAGRDRVDRVLDACCGTGGFLIEALTVMRKQVYDNPSLSNEEKRRLLNTVANEAIFGIDAGKAPNIAEIARINMYLHGDGGSRVYQTDGLRNPPKPNDSDSVEIQNDVRELVRLLDESDAGFDACLTNPPFSMNYSANVPDEAQVLQSYDLTHVGGKHRNTLRSSVMFIERYWHLLRPGGRLLTVIDDSVLSNKKHAFVRDFIRERFVIRAIISLHGDAFRSSGARVKTSVLYLTRKKTDGEAQPAAFVFESKHVGLDDVARKTPPSQSEAKKNLARQEVDEIVEAFDAYQRGEDGAWLVPAERLADRLDAKFVQPWHASDLEPVWAEAGAGPKQLSNIVDPVETPTPLEPDKRYTFIRVTYDGKCQRGETRLGREVTYSTIGTAKPGDLVVSSMGAVYKAIGVIRDGMDDLLISSEYMILRIKPDAKVDPMYLWSVLRSPAVVAEWLSGASGLARHRVNWDVLKAQSVPLLPYAEQQKIGDLYRAAHDRLVESDNLAKSADNALSTLDLDNAKAKERLERSKPPR